MQCQCGGEVLNFNHRLKTERGANVWAKGCYSLEQLPLRIDQYSCNGCKRYAFIVTDKDRKAVRRNNI